MTKSRIAAITAMAVLILMSACRLESPGGLTAVDSSSPDKTADEAFLLELEAAYDATTWTEVMFTSQRDDGSYVGYPESFAAGDYVELEVIDVAGRGLRAEPLRLYVPAVETPVVGNCVPFRVENVAPGKVYYVQSFLPARVDENDLGPGHVTYQLRGEGSGLFIADLRFASTPQAPWLTPPVSFMVRGDLVARDEEGQKKKWFVDPDETGDD